MARLSPTARREEIIAAALRVAATKGMGSTTVRDVATEMGTSSGLIHHYFASMDDVLAAAFEEAAGADLAGTQAAMRAGNGAADRLAAFFASYTRHDEFSAFQLWLDAWAEARRRPALGATSSACRPSPRRPCRAGPSASSCASSPRPSNCTAPST